MEAALAELDDRVDHLLLLGLEDALLAAALDDQAELLGADLGLVRDVRAEEPGDRPRSSPVRTAISGPRTRARKSIGTDRTSANRSGLARARVFGTSSAKMIVNRARMTVTTTRASVVGVALARARRPPGTSSSCVDEADRGVGRGEEADDRQAELRDREEPARVLEQAADAAGAGRCPPRRAARRGCGGSRRARSRPRRRSPRGGSAGRGPGCRALSRLRRRGVAVGARRGGASVAARPASAGSRLAHPGRHPDRELARRHVPRDDGAGAGLRVVADRQRAPGASCRRRGRPARPIVVRCFCRPSKLAVIVPAPTFVSVAELGVAEIAHVVLLHAAPEPGVLQLGEVADLGVRADVRAGPEVAERADPSRRPRRSSARRSTPRRGSRAPIVLSTICEPAPMRRPLPDRSSCPRRITFGSRMTSSASVTSRRA